MADRKSTATAQRDAETVHSHALLVLEEHTEELRQVYAVATAASAYVGEEQPVEQQLFKVVERYLESTMLTNRLRELIEELAECKSMKEAPAS